MTPNPPDPNAIGYTYLLSGPLGEFLRYSGQEWSQWLIDIAHDICDPAKKRGTLQVQEDADGDLWRNVNHTDPLTASIYRYHVYDTVSLSKISVRDMRSQTTETGNASTMGNCVKQRDGKCWVTASIGPIINSHVCPKRMGDHLLRTIYCNFVSPSSSPPPSQSIFDESCGITLTVTLDTWFDKYEFGLRFITMVRSSSFLFFYN